MPSTIVFRQRPDRKESSLVVTSVSKSGVHPNFLSCYIQVYSNILASCCARARASHKKPCFGILHALKCIYNKNLVKGTMSVKNLPRSRPHVSGFVCIRKHFVAVTLSVHTRIRRKLNAYGNRKLLKTVSRVETFDKATDPYTCGPLRYNITGGSARGKKVKQKNMADFGLF